MKHQQLRSVFRSLTKTLILLALGAVLWVGVSPASAEDQPTRIVFASGPDDTGTVKRIVDDFNAEHTGRIR